jgi:hypothetical protein
MRDKIYVFINGVNCGLVLNAIDGQCFCGPARCGIEEKPGPISIMDPHICDLEPTDDGWKHRRLPSVTYVVDRNVEAFATVTAPPPKYEEPPSHLSLEEGRELLLVIAPHVPLHLAAVRIEDGATLFICDGMNKPTSITKYDIELLGAARENGIRFSGLQNMLFADDWICDDFNALNMWVEM